MSGIGSVIGIDIGGGNGNSSIPVSRVCDGLVGAAVVAAVVAPICFAAL